MIASPSPFTPETAFPCPIVAGPGDTVVSLASRPLPTRHDPTQRETYWAAVHRRFGTWTHLYAAVESRRPDRRCVRLLKVLEGDRLAEATRLVADLVRGGEPPLAMAAE